MKEFPILESTPDTFESYYGVLIRNGDVLVIPYVNSGISEHSLNPAAHLKFIDRAYVVFKKVTYLKKNNIDVLVDLDQTQSSFYLGGQNFDSSIDAVEIEVKARETSLYLFDDFRISENKWLPVKTPRSEPNMNFTEALRFLKGENVPVDIVAILHWGWARHASESGSNSRGEFK